MLLVSPLEIRSRGPSRLNTPYVTGCSSNDDTPLEEDIQPYSTDLMYKDLIRHGQISSLTISSYSSHPCVSVQSYSFSESYRSRSLVQHVQFQGIFDNIYCIISICCKFKDCCVCLFVSSLLSYYVVETVSDFSSPWGNIPLGIYEEAEISGILVSLAVPVWAASFSCAVIILKWLLIRRYRPETYDLYSFRWLAWWYIDRLAAAWEISVVIYVFSCPQVLHDVLNIYYPLLNSTNSIGNVSQVYIIY